MNQIRRTLLTAAACAAVAIPAAGWAQKKYDAGASDTEIRIGSTVPLSGPASPYAGVGKGMAAYFQMINDQGGINGRKVNFILYDDGYQPPMTVDLTRRLVERDEVLFTLGALGTPTQLAVQNYMNQRKIPQLFVAAPASKLADAKRFPWTINFAPVYEMEGAIYAKHIQQNRPGAKIAVLYQDDDAGKAIRKGFIDTLSAAGLKPVLEQTYAVTDPTIDSQIIAMQGAGADVIALITIPRMTAMALRKMGSLGWKPATYVSNAGVSVKNALEPAGLDNAKGVITADYRKRMDDPRWANDPDVKAYQAFHAKYLPGISTLDEAYHIGYDLAAAATQVLQRAGDDLTRANIMKIVSTLQGFRSPLLLPGLSFNVSPDDYLGFKEEQLMQFDGKSFAPLGGVVSVR